jgi:hypothetical protein
MHDLCFVNTTISGLRATTLVETNLNHIFVSEQTTTTVHHNLERNMATFKVVNSIVKLVAGVVCYSNLRVGEWFGRLE